MSNPSLQVATRLNCVADDLESHRVFLPSLSRGYRDLPHVVRELRECAYRLEGLPPPLPARPAHVAVEQRSIVDAPERGWGAA